MSLHFYLYCQLTGFRIIVFADIRNFLAIKKQIKQSRGENSLELRNVSCNTLIVAKRWLTKTVEVSQVYQSYEASHAKTEMSEITSLWDMGGKYQKKSRRRNKDWRLGGLMRIPEQKEKHQEISIFSLPYFSYSFFHLKIFKVFLC